MHILFKNLRTHLYLLFTIIKINDISIYYPKVFARFTQDLDSNHLCQEKKIKIYLHYTLINYNNYTFFFLLIEIILKHLFKLNVAIFVTFANTFLILFFQIF